jgi:hypothetical protein
VGWRGTSTNDLTGRDSSLDSDCAGFGAAIIYISSQFRGADRGLRETRGFISYTPKGVSKIAAWSLNQSSKRAILNSRQWCAASSWCNEVGSILAPSGSVPVPTRR